MGSATDTKTCIPTAKHPKGSTLRKKWAEKELFSPWTNRVCHSLAVSAPTSSGEYDTLFNAARWGVYQAMLRADEGRPMSAFVRTRARGAVVDLIRQEGDRVGVSKSRDTEIRSRHNNVVVSQLPKMVFTAGSTETDFYGADCASDEDVAEVAVNKELADRFINLLPPKHKKVALTIALGSPLTLAAESLGVSQARVSQLKNDLKVIWALFNNQTLPDSSALQQAAAEIGRIDNPDVHIAQRVWKRYGVISPDGSRPIPGRRRSGSVSLSASVVLSKRTRHPVSSPVPHPQIDRGQQADSFKVKLAQVAAEIVGSLSDKEKEVLLALVHSEGVKGAGKYLGVSSATVKSHLYRVRSRTGYSRNQLISAMLLAEPHRVFENISVEFEISPAAQKTAALYATGKGVGEISRLTLVNVDSLKSQIAKIRRDWVSAGGVGSSDALRFNLLLLFPDAQLRLLEDLSSQ